MAWLGAGLGWAELGWAGLQRCVWRTPQRAANWSHMSLLPLNNLQLVDLVARILAYVPPWVRIYRIQRDIPMPLVSSGVEKGNLRELALARMGHLGCAGGWGALGRLVCQPRACVPACLLDLSDCTTACGSCWGASVAGGLSACSAAARPCPQAQVPGRADARVRHPGHPPQGEGREPQLPPTAGEEVLGAGRVGASKHVVALQTSPGRHLCWHPGSPPATMHPCQPLPFGTHPPHLTSLPNLSLPPFRCGPTRWS